METAEPPALSDSSASSGSEQRAHPRRATKSRAASTAAATTLPISVEYSKPCECCLCSAKSTDPNPLVQEVDEAEGILLFRPWAKYRKMVEQGVRVPEGKCCLPCFNVFRLLGKRMAMTMTKADGDDESEQFHVDGCIVQDIETLGEAEAHCIVHGKLCPLPSCDLFVIGSSCKDFSKPSPKKETQKLVFKQDSSLGGSAQTYHGFTSYVAAHLPGLVIYENVDGLEEQIGATAQSNLDILMQAMVELGYRGQPLRTDASSFGLPARRRRLYVLFVRQVNPKLQTQGRSLTESFDMFNNMVASCLRSPPCAKDLLLNPASGEVAAFLEERTEKSVKAAAKSSKSSGNWTDQRMKFAEAEGLRWAQPYPKELKLNE